MNEAVQMTEADFYDYSTPERPMSADCAGFVSLLPSLPHSVGVLLHSVSVNGLHDTNKRKEPAQRSPLKGLTQKSFECSNALIEHVRPSAHKI